MAMSTTATIEDPPSSVASSTADSPSPGTTSQSTNSDAKTDDGQTLQPIFKPLVTEKGKSKTSGKTIGGWI